jgi:hypothetical protein
MPVLGHHRRTDAYLPGSVFVQSEKYHRRNASICLVLGLDYRRDEFLQEPIDFEKIREEMVEKVDYQPFDMTSINILISHDHNFAISKLVDVSIHSLAL